MKLSLISARQIFLSFAVVICLGAAGGCDDGGDDAPESQWLIPSADMQSAHAVVVPAGELPPAAVLACRRGSETPWNTALGSLPAFNACMGSMLFAFGPVLIDSGVTGSHVASLPGAPSADIVLDCGVGCALPFEESIVVGGGVVTMVAGHTQVRFGWSPGARAWAAEPYVYSNLVAFAADGRPIRGASGPDDFAAAMAWAVVERDGAYALFKKAPSGVFRIAERNDALAAMDKAASPTQPPPMFVRGHSHEYVRSGTDQVLVEVRDNRYRSDGTGVTEIVVDREPAAGGRVTALHYDVRETTAGTHYRLTYEAGSNQLASVAQDANDPMGAQFRNPYTFVYEDETSARITQATDPSGDPVTYAWDEDNGRLIGKKHAGPQTEEDESLTFTYECDGSCGPGVTPTVVTETDEDGYVRQTTFKPFPQASAPAVYAAQKASGIVNGSVVLLDEATRTLLRRDGTGYLVRTLQVGERVMTSFNTDGQPALGGQVMRIDKNATLEAFDDERPPRKSLAEVDYQIITFDEDNMPVRVLTPAGVRRIHYQKEIHAHDEYRGIL